MWAKGKNKVKMTTIGSYMPIKTKYYVLKMDHQILFLTLGP